MCVGVFVLTATAGRRLMSGRILANITCDGVNKVYLYIYISNIYTCTCMYMCTNY